MKSLIDLIVFLSLASTIATAGPPALRLVSTAAGTDSGNLTGNGFSASPVMSSDGRYVAFVSDSSNLITNDTARTALSGFLDVFVRDRLLGQTKLVSAIPGGARGGQGDSANPGISADGRYIVFESEASDLATDDGNDARDVFLRDVSTGTTTLLSTNRTGSGSGNDESFNPIITPDGRYVVFESAASDLVAGDTNGIADIFLRDLQEGSTTLISPGAASPGFGWGSSGSARISTDGRRIAFLSTATNVVSGLTNFAPQVYIRDVSASSTAWASRDAGAFTGQSPNQTICANPVISSDGRYVVFEASVSFQPSSAIIRYDIDAATSLLITTNAAVSPEASEESGPSVSADGRFVVYEAISGSTDTALFRWDAETQQHLLVTPSVSGNEAADGISTSPVLSPDGRFVAFLSSSSNLVTSATNGDFHVYQRDIQLGVTRLLSIGSSSQTDSESLFERPAMKPDGHVVAFSTLLSPPGAGDSNDAYDVCVRDVSTEEIDLVSKRDPALASASADGWSSLARGALSANGRNVVFGSSAADVVAGDADGLKDIFVRDVEQGTTRLVSISSDGAQPNEAPSDWTLSANGRYVAFVSRATNLSTDATEAVPHLFVKDLETGRLDLASRGPDGLSRQYDPSQPIAMSSDGRIVVFMTPTPATLPPSSSLLWRDLRAGNTLEISSTIFAAPWFSLSADGRYVAYQPNQNYWIPALAVWDARNQSNIVAITNAPSIIAGQLSSDGKLLCYLQRVTRLGNELHALDFNSGTDEIIGFATISSSLPWISISSDNRWVAYVSGMDALSGDDQDNMSDVVLWDRQLKQNIVLSRNVTGTEAANGKSDCPSISADGRFVVFRSLASDLASDDENQASDVFLYDRQNDHLTLLSRALSGQAGSSLSWFPVISADGSTVVFESAADDLVAGDFNGASDVFALGLPGLAATDSDGDGLNDAWEWRFFGNLLQGPGDDYDQDGASNLAEYLAGTDAAGASSVLHIETVTSETTGGLRITWKTTAGHTYRVEYKDDLSADKWLPSVTPPVLMDGNAQVIELAPADSRQRFYRVVAAPE